MSNQNIEATKKGYDAFGAGDLEGALGIFDDSAEWTVYGESTLSGTYHGKSELTELFMRLAEKSTQVRAKRFLSDGDVVVVLAEVAAGGEVSQEADISYGDTAIQARVFDSKRVAAG